MNPKLGPALAVFLMSAACSAPPAAVAPGLPSAAAAKAPDEEAALAAARLAAAAKTVEYRIRPTDLVEITVFQQTELDRKLRVGQNGTVSLPLIGAVAIGDLTVPAAQAAISEKFKEFIVNPQVTLFIREYANKKITVLGEVKSPGSYELPSEAPMTVLGAVAAAGGFTPIAAPDRTRVIRAVNGANQTIPVVISDITKRGEKEKDIALEPNDVVYVPQSFF